MDEEWDEIIKWHQDLKFKVLPYRNGHVDSYHLHYGRFPPERRYNMDQIRMPSVIDQDATFTTEDNEHVHIKGTGVEGLNKRQYTVNVFINAGDNEENYHDYCKDGLGEEVETTISIPCYRAREKYTVGKGVGTFSSSAAGYIFRWGPLSSIRLESVIFRASIS